jgi:hypothetical protein
VDRAEQRVREPHRVGLDLDDGCGHCLGERVVGVVEDLLEDRHGRPRQRRCGEHDLGRLARKLREPRPDELAQVRWDRKRLAGPWLHRQFGQHPCDLQRVERVPAGFLMEAQERRAREREAEPLANDLE